jgi:hypothetical protein
VPAGLRATEYRDGTDRSAAQTTVTFAISLRSYHHDTANAAATLRAACLASLSWQRANQPIALGGNEFRATVRPSLARDTKRRLAGCPEDTTIDRVKGSVTVQAAIFITASVVKSAMVRSRTGRSTLLSGVTLAGERDIPGLWAGIGGEVAKWPR